MNIYKKLLEVQKKIVGLGKNSKSFGYFYVSGGKVLEHIKPIMNETGLLLKQEIIKVEKERIDYIAKGKEKSEILYNVYFKFTWIDTETGETDENMFYASGMNDWEKGLGSALTYAERYFLLKYFHINTDEDDIDNPNRKCKETQTLDRKKFEEDVRKVIKDDNLLWRYFEELEIQSFDRITREQAKALWEKVKKLQQEQPQEQPEPEHQQQ